jgi:hypothetical protein
MGSATEKKQPLKSFCPRVEKNCARSTTAVSAYAPIRSMLKMLSTYKTATMLVVMPSTQKTKSRFSRSR